MNYYRRINDRNKQLFVPWTSEFDKVILKKTIVMFRMLDEEWTSLAPNRRDHRPYRGSCSENENFYGGRSIIFCVPARFFEKKAIDVDVQLYVRRVMCKYFEMDLCQNVGFATVSVDDLLNGIAKQMRERNELSEHLSDLYKQQIISRWLRRKTRADNSLIVGNGGGKLFISSKVPIQPFDHVRCRVRKERKK